MVFNKHVTRKNKRARTSQAQAQAEEEDDEYAYINELEISDYQIDEIPVQEERNEDEMPKSPCEPQPPTFTYEESLLYQFEMMSTWFDATEKRIVHFGSWLSNIKANLS